MFQALSDGQFICSVSCISAEWIRDGFSISDCLRVSLFSDTTCIFYSFILDGTASVTVWNLLVLSNFTSQLIFSFLVGDYKSPSFSLYSTMDSVVNVLMLF